MILLMLSVQAKCTAWRAHRAEQMAMDASPWGPALSCRRARPGRGVRVVGLHARLERVERVADERHRGAGGGARGPGLPGGR